MSTLRRPGPSSRSRRRCRRAGRRCSPRAARACTPPRPSGSCSDSITSLHDPPVAGLARAGAQGAEGDHGEAGGHDDGDGDSQGREANDATPLRTARRFASSLLTDSDGEENEADSSDRGAPDEGAARPSWPHGVDRFGAPRPGTRSQPLRHRANAGAAHGRVDRRRDDGRRRVHVAARASTADGGADRRRHRAAAPRSTAA